ncbi:MAG: hypothetical protein JWN86_3982 [Planctomycetota bacterium]|nr:hypothetical protein [Planctomycetota bacterium]
MAAPTRIALEDEDGVPVIRIYDRQIMDDRIVREVGDQIMAALPPSGPVRLILDFANVTMISSAMIGRLVVLQRRADATGGLLRLCEIGSAVRDVLRTTNLDRVLKITRDRREAREAFGPAK